MELDETLTSRDVVNSKLRVILDEATDPWGIKVNRVELKNILPPREIQDAMEKQMKAERERRESILRAEGEKKSAILIAEGEKEAKILSAEAAKEAAILQAEAEKQSKIKIAEGDAEAVIRIQKANAEGIKMINEANASKEYLALKSMDTFSEVSKGRATKIIVPSEIQNMAGLLSSLKETVDDKNIEKK